MESLKTRLVPRDLLKMSRRRRREVMRIDDIEFEFIHYRHRHAKQNF